MAIELPPGFPERFPVRDDGRPSLRYRGMSWLCRTGLGAIYGGGPLTLRGLANLPERGPLLLACNHLSNLDPLILGGFLQPPLFAMAKRELFFHPLASWLWGGCNVFPVARHSADRHALRTALAVLDGGGRLVVFVEGTRQPGPGMGRAEPGIGFLLARARVPVLPVAIWGTETALVRRRLLPRRVPITVRLGRPADPPLVRRDHQATADAVARRIARLLPAAYRGVYAADGPISVPAEPPPAVPAAPG